MCVKLDRSVLYFKWTINRMKHFLCIIYFAIYILRLAHKHFDKKKVTPKLFESNTQKGSVGKKGIDLNR